MDVHPAETFITGAQGLTFESTRDRLTDTKGRSSSVETTFCAIEQNDAEIEEEAAVVSTARMHQINTETDAYVHVGKHKTAKTYIAKGVRSSRKFKPCASEEILIYNDLLEKSAPFMLEHKLDDDGALVRYGISSLSIADVFMLIEGRDFKSLDLAIRKTTKYSLPSFPHTDGLVEHSCCLPCRNYLCFLGLIFNRIFANCKKFCIVASKSYNFILTADNVDLNGILDFEHFVLLQPDATPMPVVKIMAPYLDIFWRLYAHVGCYFISSPIMKNPSVENYLRHMNMRGVRRITLKEFADFYMLNDYLGFELKDRLYDFFADIKYELPFKAQGMHVIPISDNYTDISKFVCPQEKPSVVFVSVSYHDLERYRDTIFRISDDYCARILVTDHPMQPFHQLAIYRYYFNVLFNSMYDCNVPISCFNTIGETVTFPILGELPNGFMSGCCDAPNETTKLLDCSTANKAASMLEYREKFEPTNPLYVFDTKMVRYGDFSVGSRFAVKPRTNVDIVDNVDFIDFAAARGIRIELAGLQQDDFSLGTASTYTTKYSVKVPTESGVKEDFDLYNMNADSSFSPNLFVLSAAKVIRDFSKIVKSDDELLGVRHPSTIKVSNPRKSAGTPLNKIGTAGMIRDYVTPEGIVAMFKHSAHSIMKSLTTIMNKVSISIKNRDRTISSNSFYFTCVGRMLYRAVLDKIKNAVYKGGVVLIGFNPMGGGWDKIIRSIEVQPVIACSDDDEADECRVSSENTEAHCKTSSIDFPKFDRVLVNCLQLVSRSIPFVYHDGIANEVDGYSVCDVFRSFVAEMVNVIFDHIVFNGSLWQKTAGVTSGSAATADANSNAHLFMSAYCSFDTLIRRTDSKEPILHRELRTQLARLSFMTPAEFLMSDYGPLGPHLDGMLETIEKHICYQRVLSDDGLMAFDDRLIDFNEIAKKLYMVSKYKTSPEKYTIHKYGEPPEEFLSQHTVLIDGKYFPRPVFDRILGSLIQAPSDSMFSEQINAARCIALYLLLYVYRFCGDVKQKAFLDLLRDYIVSKGETVDMKFLVGIDCGVRIDVDDVVETRHLDSYCARIIGIDESGSVTGSHKIDIEAAIGVPCFVCDQPTLLRCHCGFSLCNAIDQSHLYQHMLSADHWICTYKNVRIQCQFGGCREADVRKLLLGSDNRTYCTSHSSCDNKLLGAEGLLCHTNRHGAVLESDDLNSALGVMASLLSRHYTNALVQSMTLVKCGYPRPFWHVVFSMQQIEHCIIKDLSIKLEFELLPESNDGMMRIALHERPNLRALEYWLTFEDSSTEALVNDADISYDLQNCRYVWSFRPVNRGTPTKLVATHINYVEPYIDRYALPLTDGVKRLFVKPLEFERNSDKFAELQNSIAVNGITFVHGPPGSGKTTLLSKLVKKVHADGKSIALLAPSHQAVDVLLRMAMSERLPVKRVIRNDKGRSCTVRGATLVDNIPSAGRFYAATLRTFALSSRGRAPDYVLIDEMSMANDADILLTVSKCVNSKVIFCGDPYQLSSVDSYREGLSQAKYANIVCYLLNDYPHVFLQYNYRSIPDIVDFISVNFYDGRLESKSRLSVDLVPYSKGVKRGVRFLRVQAVVGRSVNTDELDKLDKILSNYAIYNPNMASVAIYCAYHVQLSNVRGYLKKKKFPFSVEASTIDSGQGAEVDIAIVLLTANNNFTADFCRLNVACSRARYLTILSVPEGLERRVKFLTDPSRDIIPHSIIAELNLLSSRERCINIRGVKPDDQLVLPFLRSDYIFFDCEYFNLRRDRKIPALFSYAAVSEGSPDLKVCGLPEVLTDYGYRNVRLRRDDFIVVAGIRDTFELTFAQCSAQSGTPVMINNLVDYIVSDCTNPRMYPCLVTYGGMNDYAHVKQFCTKYASCTASKNCTYIPYFVSGNARLCGYHFRDRPVTGLCNVGFITFQIRVRSGRYCVEGNCPFLNALVLDCDVNLPEVRDGSTLRNSVAHDLFGCGGTHGVLHDPTTDAALTRCTFFSLLDRLVGGDYALATPNIDSHYNTYRGKVHKSKHSVVRTLMKPFKGDYCDMGCGFEKNPDARCCIDIVDGHDMNEHVCSSSVELYVDSFYYRTSNLSKPAFVLYDAEPSHYSKTIYGDYVHNRSSRFRYFSRSIPDFGGDDAFELLFPKCAGDDVITVNSSVDFYAPKCLKHSDLAIVMCKAHSDSMELLINIRSLIDYGYKFVRLTTLQSTEIQHEKMILPSKLVVRARYYNLLQLINYADPHIRKVAVYTDKTRINKITQIKDACSTAGFSVTLIDDKVDIKNYWIVKDVTRLTAFEAAIFEFFNMGNLVSTLEKAVSLNKFNYVVIRQFDDANLLPSYKRYRFRPAAASNLNEQWYLYYLGRLDTPVKLRYVFYDLSKLRFVDSSAARASRINRSEFDMKF